MSSAYDVRTPVPVPPSRLGVDAKAQTVAVSIAKVVACTDFSLADRRTTLAAEGKNLQDGWTEDYKHLHDPEEVTVILKTQEVAVELKMS